MPATQCGGSPRKSTPPRRGLPISRRARECTPVQAGKKTRPVPSARPAAGLSTGATGSPLDLRGLAFFLDVRVDDVGITNAIIAQYRNAIIRTGPGLGPDSFPDVLAPR